MSVDADDENKLGPAIYTVGKASSVYAYIVIGSVFVVFGVCAIVQDLPRGMGIEIKIGSVTLGLMIAFAGALWWWYNDRDYRTSLHEYGISRIHRGQRTTILFADAQAVTYAYTRHFLNSVYTQTSESICIERGEPEQKSLLFEHGFKELDPKGRMLKTEVYRLASEAAVLLASRWAIVLEKGEHLPWIRGIDLSREGLIMKPVPWWYLEARDLLRSAPPDRISWDQIGDVQMKDGNFFLSVPESRRPIFRAKTSSRNFLPGYFLLLTAKDGGMPAVRELARAAT